MTKKEAIEHVCHTVGIVYESMGKFEEPCDCFCIEGNNPTYHMTESFLQYVRQAVIEKLEKDGFVVKETI